jgi:hypothetical protein
MTYRYYISIYPVSGFEKNASITSVMALAKEEAAKQLASSKHWYNYLRNNGEGVAQAAYDTANMAILENPRIRRAYMQACATSAGGMSPGYNPLKAVRMMVGI